MSQSQNVSNDAVSGLNPLSYLNQNQPATVLRVSVPRAPTTSDRRFKIGTMWLDTSSDSSYQLIRIVNNAAQWAILGPGTTNLDELDADSGSATPTAGVINILGGTGVSTTASGNNLTINASAGQASISEFVVASDGSADYTTVQAAITAASSGDAVYVRPGSYTEDLTLKAGVSIVGAGGAYGAAGVTITGTHTPPSTGNVSFDSCTLADATTLVSSVAAGTGSITFENCQINVTNGYCCDVASWVGDLVWQNCAFGGTTDGVTNNTGGSAQLAANSNMGAGSGNAWSVSGSFDMQACEVFVPMSFVTGATAVSIKNSHIEDPLTLSNDSAGELFNTSILSGASAAITMSSSGNWDISSCTLDSSNSPCLDGAGAGTLTIGFLNFLSNSEVAATLTTSLQETLSGTSFATTFDTNVAAAAMTLSGTDIDADGTDANISITVTPKGSGTLTVDSGGILNTDGDIINTHSDAAADVTVEVTNTDNTSASSRAGFEASTGGTSSGDPYVNFLISGGQTFTMGIDNSTTNDDFVISDDAALGTANRISIDGSSGDVSVPTSDLSVSRSETSGTVSASVVNTDDTMGDSQAEIAVTSGGTSGGDAQYVASVSGGQAYAFGVDNSTTNDDFVISDNATVGTNNRVSIDGSTGDVTLPTSDLAVSRAEISGTVLASVVNSDNTMTDSLAQISVASGGTSGGDSQFSASITGGQVFSFGVDNSTTNDDFVISDGAALGTGNVLEIDGSTSDVTVSTGNLVIGSVAKQLQMNGGAVTDFIGQATLTLGTVTVSNTNIAANDRVLLTRTAINTPGALGTPVVTVNAGSDFVITALSAADGSTTVTSDVSTFDYFIVRQN